MDLINLCAYDFDWFFGFLEGYPKFLDELIFVRLPCNLDVEDFPVDFKLGAFEACVRYPEYEDISPEIRRSLVSI